MSSNLRHFSFKVRVAENWGITPFGTDKPISGTFTYNLDSVRNARPERPNAARFVSPHNRMAFILGDHQFVSDGIVDVTISQRPGIGGEAIYVSAESLRLPPGWAYAKIDPEAYGPAFSIGFGNRPTRNLLDCHHLPDSIRFEDFPGGSCEIHFPEGVRYPGGEVEHRTMLEGEVTELVEI